MASKVLELGVALGLFPPTLKSLMLFIATAGSLPERIRGRDGPMAIARNASADAG